MLKISQTRRINCEKYSLWHFVEHLVCTILSSGLTLEWIWE